MSKIRKAFAVSQEIADHEATALRRRIAEMLQPDYQNGFDRGRARKLIANSPFAQDVLTFPADDPLRVLAFNLEITQHAVADLLANCEAPDRLAFVAARTAELSLYDLFDPSNISRSIQYLGASKRLGYFFTPPEVAALMADLAIGGRREIRLLMDPAAGCGSLLAAALVRAAQSKIKVERVVALELDAFTSSILRRVLERVRVITGGTWDLEVRTGDGIAILDDDPGMNGYSADCIVMNPPYGRVKFLRNSLTNAETRVKTSRVSLEVLNARGKTTAHARAEELRALAERIGIDTGPQDYQRIFLGLGAQSLAAGGRLAAIAPSSWLGDRESKKLRRRLIEHRMLEEVIIFPEDAGLFATVNQPTAIAVLASPGVRERFTVRIAGSSLTHGNGYEIAFADIARHDPDLLRIPRIPADTYHILEHLQEFPRIRDCVDIKNARGEFDQTLDQKAFRTHPTSLRLIRGDHIERYTLRPSSYSELTSYLDPAVLGQSDRGKPKWADITKPRVVGRQCSYMKKERRLSFVFINAPAALGNSCNYLCLTGERDDQDEDRLHAIAALLNSAVLEWYFRVYSANNHVGNYEIADLPVCLADRNVVEMLAKCSRLMHHGYAGVESGGKVATRIEDFTDALVAHGFRLSPYQAALVLQQVDASRATRVAGMVQWLTEHPNDPTLLCGHGAQLHVIPSLSAIDREMIRHVPQGGNWQNIPRSVPSKRLEQIRTMTAERGVVRTTYYGRLRADQPAYTIATYYNRPGNGTNIHPWEERTLTSREAARLQSFPDWYWFTGREGSIRKQIGNAVPPLLAAAIGRHLLSQAQRTGCVDLFAGAGGLSLGLELAGWDVIAAVDNNLQALSTYRLNRDCETEPHSQSGRTLVMQADLSTRPEKRRIIESIRRKLGSRRLGLLIGGPPCQGYSHAGWRAEGDCRNDLAAGFMEFVFALEPELVVIENVEGLLTFADGRVVRDLLRTLEELGYSIGLSPWKLAAEEYCVPQMRRRVFLVGSRSRLIGLPPPMLARCAGRRQRGLPELFAELPPPVTAAEALRGLPVLSPEVRGVSGKEGGRDAYSMWARGRMRYEELVETLSGVKLQFQRAGGAGKERLQPTA